MVDMGMGRCASKYPINNFNKTNLSYLFQMFHNTLSSKPTSTASKLQCTVFLNLEQGFYILIFCDAIGTSTREIKRKLAILSLLSTTLFFSTRVEDFESVFKCPNNKIGIVRTIARKIYQPVY